MQLKKKNDKKRRAGREASYFPINNIYIPEIFHDE